MPSNNDDENDPNDLTEQALQEVEELLADNEELKKVAANNILRACHLLDKDEKDSDIAELLLREAVVMMQVAHRIDTFFGDESKK